MCFTKSQALQGIRMESGSVAAHVFNTCDILEEILVRVLPEFISKPLLVSKRWFELIRSSSFRDHYISRWRHALPLVGFKGFYVRNKSFIKTPMSKRSISRHPWDHGRQFFPLINGKDKDEDDCGLGGVFQQHDYFIDSSYNGILLIGRQIEPFIYIVWNPFTRKHYELPPPRKNYEHGSVAFVTEYHRDTGLFHYKVFRAMSTLSDKVAITFKVWIQTFSSETGSWKQRTFPPGRSDGLLLDYYSVGTVIRGVVYWPASFGDVLMYDPNLQLVSPISSPPEFEICINGGLGASSDGLLQYAQMSRSVMRIWILDSNRQWNLRYAVNLKTVLSSWSRCLCQYRQCHYLRRFMSFVPQNSEYAFVRVHDKMFLIHLPSEKVEEVDYHHSVSGSGSGSSSYRGNWMPYFNWACPWPSLLPNRTL